MKKVLAMVLIVALMGVFLTACSEQKTEQTQSQSEKKDPSEPSEIAEKVEEAKVANEEIQPSYLDDTSPITLDWYINFSWFPTKWGGDATSEYITEKTGVSINYIVPAGNEAEKINSMIAGDTLPDLITLGWWESQVDAMIQGDLVYALDELAEEYDPYFFQVANSGRINWYTKDDGHVYGYPNASYSPEDYEKYELTSNQTFLVRKDMYEAIGSPDMRTPEGFLQALRDVKAMFPEVNGQPLIPIGFHDFNDEGCSSLEEYLQNFLAIQQEDENGNLVDRTKDPEYIEWLKVFRQANEEGLIAVDVFIDSRPQMEEKIAQGRYFSMLYQRSDLTAQNNIRFQEDPDTVYIAVDGPANDRLDQPLLDGDGIAGWTLTLISKNCKDPERAIKFMSYMMSEEGQLDLFMGPEGVTWENINGKPTWKPEVKETLDTDRNTFDNLYGASYTYWMLMDNPMSKQWESEPVEPFAQLYNWTKGKAVNKSQYSDLTLEPGSKLAIEEGKINSEWGETLPQLIMAETEEEFDQIWTEFMSYREEHSWEEIFDYQQQKLDDNKKRLGIN
ncbi:extracellular solute-binding protein [Vallitalea okinawensis]|uniref:extracellular solute-binding protein n=1 Tax=Vallitalea okinawensis TaxID=2078660 RepID=UPI000CFA9A4A|nr:extracellular solute-binding protein [Vallitalea okinawensis]